MNLTPAQHRAIYEHHKNLVVVAGAGTGKTRVLVERYLALLDQHPEWPLNALVAITFTRKAAQEMRDRVRQALEDRLGRAQNPNEQHIWSGRIASMDSARIDTIHGLCATILRANAAEARLDPDFAVLDEVDAGILLESVIDDQLQALVDENDPAAQLLGEYDSKILRDALKSFAESELAEMPGDLFASWQMQWEQNAAQEIDILRQNTDFLASTNWQPPGGWPAVDDKLLIIWEECLHWLELLFRDVSVQNCLDSLRGLAGGIKVNVGSASSWGSKEILAESKDALRLIRESAKTALENMGDPPGAAEEKAARLLPIWYSLIRRVQAAYREAKQQQAALDFNDLERVTCDLLAHHATVRARYQNTEFKHVLVDEFQDTNGAQWEIVRGLADPAAPGCLFVVGDQKQSIYAFRGADVSVFGGVRRTLTEIWGGDSEVMLSRSFRAHQPLVSCFNTLFERILTRDPDSPVYEYQIDLGEAMDAHRQTPPADNPALEFWLVDKDTAKAEDENRTFNAEDFRRWEAFEIATRLRAMVEAGTSVFDRVQGIRPIQYDDIALLFQSTSNITLYEDVFKAQGLPFVTVAGRGYYSRQEVWDLLNLLRALYNPADNLSLASALRSPLFAVSDDALLALRLVRDLENKRINLWDALDISHAVPLDEQNLVAFARDCLYDLRAMAGRVTISELLREALARTGYLATLTGLADGARRRGNIEKLLEKAESSGKVTLGAFSQYLNDLSAREVREGEALVDVEGAVTLMTVHASKGLEFPVVVLVDASWERGNRDGGLLIHDPRGGLSCKVYNPDEDKLVSPFNYKQSNRLREMRETAERKRLLYVAATRAQDTLIVSGQISQNKDGKLKGDWLNWMLEALHLLEKLQQAGESHVQRGWGSVRMNVSVTMPPEDFEDRDPVSAWDSVQLGEAVVQPPLMADILVERTAVARHLSVTNLGDIGAAFNPENPYFRQRFRRDLLHDAPSHIDSVRQTRNKTGRMIGEIVHEALHWWDFFGENKNLEQQLESYAWKQGIVDAVEHWQAVQKAHELLSKFQVSPIHKWVKESRKFYRELPFIYKTEKRMIHGIIDLLIQHNDGTWVIVDYKTSHVPNGAQDYEAVRNHAQRYHLQVGAYAQAVIKQLELLKLDADKLQVYIHYIRYNQTIPIQSQEWESALENLEGFIDRLIG